MTMKNALSHIGCSRQTMTKWIKMGKLTPTKDNLGHLVFDVREIRKMAGQYDDNMDMRKIKGLHAAPLPKQVSTYLKEKQDEDILNHFGKQELMRITEQLNDLGFLPLADKGVILRYSIAIQMQNRYLHEMKEDEGNPIYIKMYEMFTKQVTGYEKSLGLTPESASKLNPPAPKVEDEMEGFLNG